jgi:hypothetical protein
MEGTIMRLLQLKYMLLSLVCICAASSNAQQRAQDVHERANLAHGPFAGVNVALMAAQSGQWDLVVEMLRWQSKAELTPEFWELALAMLRHKIREEVQSVARAIIHRDEEVVLPRPYDGTSDALVDLEMDAVVPEVVTPKSSEEYVIIFLVAAASKQNWPITCLLVSMCPSLSSNIMLADNVTLLWWTARHKRWDLVEHLLDDQNADVTFVPKEGRHRFIPVYWLAAYDNQWRLFGKMMTHAPRADLMVAPVEGRYKGVTVVDLLSRLERGN